MDWRRAAAPAAALLRIPPRESGIARPRWSVLPGRIVAASVPSTREPMLRSSIHLVFRFVTSSRGVWVDRPSCSAVIARRRGCLAERRSLLSVLVKKESSEGPSSGFRHTGLPLDPVAALHGCPFAAAMGGLVVGRGLTIGAGACDHRILPQDVGIAGTSATVISARRWSCWLTAHRHGSEISGQSTLQTASQRPCVPLPLDRHAKQRATGTTLALPNRPGVFAARGDLTRRGERCPALNRQ